MVLHIRNKPISTIPYEGFFLPHQWFLDPEFSQFYNFWIRIVIVHDLWILKHTFRNCSISAFSIFRKKGKGNYPPSWTHTKECKILIILYIHINQCPTSQNRKKFKFFWKRPRNQFFKKSHKFSFLQKWPPFAQISTFLALDFCNHP